jgi:hypothetical protein
MQKKKEKKKEFSNCFKNLGNTGSLIIFGEDDRH